MPYELQTGAQHVAQLLVGNMNVPSASRQRKRSVTNVAAWQKKDSCPLYSVFPLFPTYTHKLRLLVWVTAHVWTQTDRERAHQDQCGNCMQLLLTKAMCLWPTRFSADTVAPSVRRNKTSPVTGHCTLGRCQVIQRANYMVI